MFILWVSAFGILYYFIGKWCFDSKDDIENFDELEKDLTLLKDQLKLQEMGAGSSALRHQLIGGEKEGARALFKAITTKTMSKSKLEKFIGKSYV